MSRVCTLIRRSRRVIIVLSLSVITFSLPGQPTTPRVFVDRQNFNPSLNEAVSLTVRGLGTGHVSIAVIDRDGFVTLWLAEHVAVSGTYATTWDGHDANRMIVADEAYSFKIDFVSSTGDHWAYFPASVPPKIHSIRAKHYSRRNAALMYDLPSPCRVHAQAGAALIDTKAATYDGPVLKTLVNREPRPAGAIVESWNGLDESGAIYVPDLPHFVTAILAAELPEGAVIAYGNRDRTFLDVAMAKRGKSLLPSTVVESNAHHHGLSALSDASPALVVTPLNARWDAHETAWILRGTTADLDVRLSGPTANYVAKQPGKIIGFIDYTERSQRAVRVGLTATTIRLNVSGGPHVITVNWQSDYGPLAAYSIRVIGAIEHAGVKDQTTIVDARAQAR